MKKLEEQKQEDEGGDKEKEKEQSYRKHKPCNIFINS